MRCICILIETAVICSCISQYMDVLCESHLSSPELYGVNTRPRLCACQIGQHCDSQIGLHILVWDHLRPSAEQIIFQIFGIFLFTRKKGIVNFQEQVTYAQHPSRKKNCFFPFVKFSLFSFFYNKMSQYTPLSPHLFFLYKRGFEAQQTYQGQVEIPNKQIPRIQGQAKFAIHTTHLLSSCQVQDRHKGQATQTRGLGLKILGDNKGL